METAKSIGLFLLAGLCEIGGGYLVWQWLREGRSVWLGLIGGVVLVLYGIIPTLQPSCLYLRARVCGLRWGVYRAVLVVGMEDRRQDAGYV